MNKSRIPLILILILVWVALSGWQPLSQQVMASSLLAPSPKPVLAPTAPDPFGKLTPADGAPDQPTNNLALRWGASTPGATYQYCLRLSRSAACPKRKWISVGTNTSVILQGLTANTTYYWQVRAVDSTGQITEADGGTRWSFKTVLNPNLPGPFAKSSPADLSIDRPINNLSLTWSASNLATSYQYCYDTLNNNSCDTSWTNATGQSAILSGLSYGTTYYWQVRAVNAAGNVQANNAEWWSFQTVPAPGGAFDKTDPLNNATEQPVSLTLTWGLSSGVGITYEYCLSTSTCTASSTWTSVLTELSVDISNLQYATTYYWQVRAVNQAGAIYANGGAVWKFSTVIAPPAAFGKSSPAKNEPGAPVSLNLTWSPSTGASSYEYCLSTSTCTFSSTWLQAGTNTSVGVSGLAYSTLYYWQVRAINTTGTTYADGGEVWQFTTQNAPPYAFAKLSPPAGSLEKVPPTLILQWSPSEGATEYFFCIDTVSHPDGDATCTSPGWVSNGSSTETAHLSLLYGTTYHWQVRAVNSQGTALADGGVWWSFTTLDAPPEEFTKTSPATGAIDQSLTPWLYWWTPSNPAATYDYSICTADPCPSPAWTTIAENEPIHITTPLSHGITYYWQVRSLSGGVYEEANSGAWWSFTTLQSPPTSSDQAFSTDEDTPLNGTLAANSNYEKVFSLYGSLPAGVLDFHTDGTFVYTPVSHFNGAVTFQFILSDGHNPPVGPFTATITVNPVNNPPVLSAISDQVGERGKQLAFYAHATDPDLPYGDYLTYSVDETLPSGATIDPITGLFSWLVPSNQASGVLTFTVRVADSGGLSDTQLVKITINAANRPPVLNPIADLLGERGKELKFDALATDPDLPNGDHLNYSIDETLPTGASIDPTTGHFSWLVPTNQGIGTLTFTVRVTDSGSLSDSVTVNITIPNFKLVLPLVYN